MKIENKYKILWILSFVQLFIVCVLIPFLPETIPIQYDVYGEISRISNKNELLIIPLFTIATGFMGASFAKRERKKPEYNNEKVILNITILLLSIESFIIYAILYKNFVYAQKISSDINLEVLSSVSIGMLFCILGNILPKVQKNSFIGLRTIWSMYSNETWRKSQRFTGIAFILCGFSTIFYAIFIQKSSMVFSVSVLLITTIICTAASYKYYKIDRSNSND